MPTNFTRRGAVALAALAAGHTAARGETPKKRKTRVSAPAARPVMTAKAVTPQQITSTTIAETIAQSLTLNPGDSIQLFAKSDFTGAVSVAISVYSSPDQDLSNTEYLIWWANAAYPFYTVSDVLHGDQLAFLNTGGQQFAAFGNQLLIEARNNGDQPVNITQVTAYAIAS